MAGTDGIGFTVFVEEVGEAYFEKNVVIFDVLLEFCFVFDDGVVEGDTIGANYIGINDVIVFGVRVTHGGCDVPNFVGMGRFVIHAGDNSSDEYNYDCYDSEDS